MDKTEGGTQFELPIFDKSGKEVGKYSIDTKTVAEKITPQLMHDAVVMYLANLRQGSAKSKRRDEVAGAKKKMYRQKGTGNARAGSRRSGVRRGGGHIFAKHPQDWSYRLPRKALQSALRMAVASRIADSQVMLIDTLSADKPKTKDMAAVLKALKIDTTVLVAVGSYDANLYKSFRNIDGVRFLPLCDLNAHEVLRPKKVLMTKEALDQFVASVPKKKEKAEA